MLAWPRALCDWEPASGLPTLVNRSQRCFHTAPPGDPGRMADEQRTGANLGSHCGEFSSAASGASLHRRSHTLSLSHYFLCCRDFTSWPQPTASSSLPPMQTRAAAKRAPWPQLPTPLWERIAGLLPTVGDVAALRQAWRGAAQLDDARMRAFAASALQSELADCVWVTRNTVKVTAIEGVAEMEAEVEAMGVAADDPEVAFLEWVTAWMEGAMEAAHEERSVRCLPERPLWPKRWGYDAGVRRWAGGGGPRPCGRDMELHSGSSLSPAGM